MDLDPSNPHSADNLGVRFQEQGLYAMAEYYYRRSVEAVKETGPSAPFLVRGRVGGRLGLARGSSRSCRFVEAVKEVGPFFLSDTHYRNQFETGASGGFLGRVRGLPFRSCFSLPTTGNKSTVI